MIAKLPDEILLEIFDFYRQSFEHQPTYERDWNNKNGWFKLAHVCHNWRSIVLTSSSRLQLRLLFTDRTPTRAAVLRGLPHLPIVVDYLRVSWTVGRLGSENRLISALRYPDRVNKIAMKITFSNRNTIARAIDCAFPTLATLELHNTGTPGFWFPPTFLMTSTKSLQRLQIPGATLISLPPLLTATTALVDLTLGIDTIFSPLQGMSLLALLQNLSRLRHLDVSVRQLYAPHTRAIPPVKTNGTVSLAELTYFRFKGNATEVEELVVGLATPSLQKLYVTLYCLNSAFHVPNLLAIIRNMGTLFNAAQIKVPMRGAYIISLLTHSHFIDDLPFNVFVDGQSAIAQVGSELSAMLATVEDLFIAFSPPYIHIHPGSLRVDIAPFLEQLHNVKILRVQHGLETEVADVLREYNGQPTTNHLYRVSDGADLDATISSDIPNNPSRSNVGIFPSLEGIQVHPKSPGTQIPESERASYLEPFEELVTARQQAGCPVNLYCNIDQVLPTSFL